MKDRKRRYVNLFLDETMLEQIDQFQALNRFTSRTEAMRWLLQFALDRKPRLELTTRKKD